MPTGAGADFAALTFSIAHHQPCGYHFRQVRKPPGPAPEPLIATVARDGRGPYRATRARLHRKPVARTAVDLRPCGQEEAVRTVCARKLQTLVDDMWIDDAGNLIGYIGADDAESPSG